MEKKILKFQLYSLFILTTLNLAYFYYRDSLPDNYYEISFENSSTNFFSYYFSSVLANFGYWCGIWVTLAFISFALISTFLLNKKNGYKNISVAFVLLLSVLVISYLFFPESLGEGLLYIIQENFSFIHLSLSLVFLLASLFYLISEKKFFRALNFIWEGVQSIYNIVLYFDYSKLKQFDYNKKILNLRQSISDLYKKLIPQKLTITPSPEFIKKDKRIIFPPIEKSRPVSEMKTPISEEIQKEDVEPQEIEYENEFISGTEELHSTSVQGDDFEEVDSPFTKEQEKFFESEELIDCIVPKKVVNHLNDPDNNYFEKIARAIEEKLKEFNINAHVINVLKGPVVDTFELELGVGVKVSGVTNRTDDLSLALKGVPIRMVYPMKGKSTIGLEVPRNPRDVIYLDEVLKSEQFNQSVFKLPIAMGKDAYGDAAVIDLASTPHLLVAGTTGAGKSVFINTLLVSLIIKFSPKKLRLIMLDPKQLELALYQKLPHLIMPVVTDSQMASVALIWTIEEMERRYSLLKDFGVKNIEGFNRKLKDASSDLTCKIAKYYPDVEIEDFELPYIVVVVDEFADLMLSKSGKAIETSISRLAAKARASGIHIVLATQRPSTDIITGVIKANFPTRVSFRVFTNIDSRVILDAPGAEKLLGKGDMLFKQGTDVFRMHSAYVDENEIEALVSKLSSLPAQYDPGAMEFIENNGIVDDDVQGLTTDGEGGGIKDDKYEEAVRCVATYRLASASYIQRRLGVGYNRAANLIEEMERQGVVGPAQGSKPRKVLIPPPSDSTP